MRFPLKINKDTDIHSEYVIFIAFPLQQCLRERISMLPISTLVVTLTGFFSYGKKNIRRTHFEVVLQVHCKVQGVLISS